MMHRRRRCAARSPSRRARVVVFCSTHMHHSNAQFSTQHSAVYTGQYVRRHAICRTRTAGSGHGRAARKYRPEKSFSSAHAHATCARVVCVIGVRATSARCVSCHAAINSISTIRAQGADAGDLVARAMMMHRRRRCAARRDATGTTQRLSRAQWYSAAHMHHYSAQCQDATQCQYAPRRYARRHAIFRTADTDTGHGHAARKLPARKSFCSAHTRANIRARNMCAWCMARARVCVARVQHWFAVYHFMLQ